VAASLLPAVLGLTICANAQADENKDSLRIEVEGIRKPVGVMRASIWDSEQSFLHSPPLASVNARVTAGRMTLQFDKLKDGVYGVAIYQDENGNGRLDTGFMGIPKEPYGFSNGAHIRFGPPNFKDVSFLFHGDGTITIQLMTR
jgi:uncharacterized protein (DUF2141 family)